MLLRKVVFIYIYISLFTIFRESEQDICDEVRLMRKILTKDVSRGVFIFKKLIPYSNIIKFCWLYLYFEKSFMAWKCDCGYILTQAS